jgi:hypothetical protein
VRGQGRIEKRARKRASDLCSVTGRKRNKSVITEIIVTNLYTGDSLEDREHAEEVIW